jgi:hypothetical protein
MKNLILLISLGITCQRLFAQGVGINTLTPDPSAALEIQSTNQGLLIPRVNLQSLTDGQTISSPAHSLIIYNQNSNLPGGTGFYYNSGTKAAPEWKELGSSNNNVNPSVAFRAAGVVPQQTIPGLSSARVLFGTESYDLSNNYNDAATQEGSLFTAPMKGIYHFDVSVFALPATIGGISRMTLQQTKNGVSTIVAEYLFSTEANLSTDIGLDEGDKVFVVMDNLKSGGSDLHFDNNSGHSYFSGRLVFKQP